MGKKNSPNNISQKGYEIPDVNTRFGFLCYVHSLVIILWQFHLLCKVSTVGIAYIRIHGAQDQFGSITKTLAVIFKIVTIFNQIT